MMTPRRSSLRRAVAAVAVPLCLPLLAACGEGEKPELKRSPASESPSVSESPSASESPEPEPETAKEFIRRWQKAEDKMQNTGNTKPYRKLVTRFCNSCEDLADRIDEIYEAGGKITFGGSTIVRLSRSGGTKQNPKYEMELRGSSTTFVERKGAEPQKLPGGVATFEIYLTKRNGAWKIKNALARPQ